MHLTALTKETYFNLSWLQLKRVQNYSIKLDIYAKHCSNYVRTLLRFANKQPQINFHFNNFVLVKCLCIKISCKSNFIVWCKITCTKISRKNQVKKHTFQFYHCLEILAYDSMTNLLGAGIDEKGFQTDQKLRN